MIFASRPAATLSFRRQLAQVKQVLPGLALGFFEVTVLTAVSVAISTRLPMLVNLVVCISIFFLGHLTPILVEATTGNKANELVHFMANLFAFGLPELEFFNASPAISTGAVIPWFSYVPARARLLRDVQWRGPGSSPSSSSRTATSPET